MKRLLDGKIALVTGAGAGIGRATALAFAREGARVMVSDVNEDGGIQTATMIRKEGGEAAFFRADIARENDVVALLGETTKKFGRLDVAHNNAGIEGNLAPLAECTLENFDRIIATNLRGTFLCMKYELPVMLAAGGGAIVNTASIAGLIGFPGLSAYVASKHGVNGLTKNAALEYGAKGIRVNSVCPGGIDTRMLDSLANQSHAKSAAAMFGPMHPLGRIGTPDEVARLVTWLCSDQASFMNGAHIPVDGGFVAQ